MFKRGQITLFILLGIAIILAVSTAVIVKQKSAVDTASTRIAKTALESDKIKSYVDSCLYEVSQKGIRLVALQGGYINSRGDYKYAEQGDGFASKTHYFFSNTALPYLWFDKKSQLRPINDVKTKLANYVVVEMQNCLNFSQFEQQNYRIKKPNIKQIRNADENGISVDYSSSKVKADFVLSDETTAVSLKYPLVFERGETKTELVDFSANIPLRLSLLYNIANKLLKNNLEEKYEVHKHCEELSSKDKLVNIYVRTNQYDYDSVVQIIDIKPLISKKEIPLKFQFATRNAKLEGDCVG